MVKPRTKQFLAEKEIILAFERWFSKYYDHFWLEKTQRNSYLTKNIYESRLWICLKNKVPDIQEDSGLTWFNRAKPRQWKYDLLVSIILTRILLGTWDYLSSQARLAKEQTQIKQAWVNSLFSSIWMKTQALTQLSVKSWGFYLSIQKSKGNSASIVYDVFQHITAHSCLLKKVFPPP